MAGAVFGMICSVISMTAAMMIANIIITPHFMGTTTEAVIEMIPTILFPFNLTKAIFNASLSFIIYKPVSMALKNAGFIKAKDTMKGAAGNGKAKYRPSPAAIAVPAVIAVASMLFFFIALEGTFNFAW